MRPFSSYALSDYAVIPIIFLLSITQAHSQTIIPQNSTGNTLLPYTIPTSYSNPSRVNFVRNWIAQAPITAPTPTDLSNRLKYVEATAYFDGLGRPLEEVSRAASPDGAKDIVTVHVYDEVGREAQQYLPYPVIPSSGYEGRYKTNPFTAQAVYYQTNYGDKRPFSQIDFEVSSLNRPLASFAPGNSWMGSSGTTNKHAIQNSYETNGTNEVVVWNIGFIAGSLPIKASGSTYYSAGELYRNVISDEQGSRVVEYKDKEDHLILKKVELPSTNTPSAITSHSGWLCTYYVYDKFGLLRAIIPPKAVEWLSTSTHNWIFPTPITPGDIINELCFRYEYDSRNRMIVKKVPGKGEEWMVYDKRDRLIMTQDALQRNLGKWLVTQYEDNLNRPIRTYLWSNIESRIDHETNSMSTTSPVDYPALSGSYDLLTETYYDDYTWVSSSGTTLSATFDAGQVNSDFLTASTTISPYPQTVAADAAVKGMVTGTKINVLGTSNYLYTITFYDNRGRVVQVQSTNQVGGKDIVTTQYSFDGKPLVARRMHQLVSTNNQLYTVNRMSYDHMGRLLKTTHQITEGYTQYPETVTAESEYDDLGKLKTKKLGQQRNPAIYNDPGTTGYSTNRLETLDYTYNIRGWLTGINRGYAHPDRWGAEATLQIDRWFGMELNYDWGFSNKQYNGNIAGTIWRSQGDGKTRAYGFDYDAANRLLKADFTQNEGTNTWGINDGINFSMQMGNSTTPAYDANGNIGAMQQHGYKTGSGSSLIDNMQYAYFANTNKLQSVTDAAASTAASGSPGLGDFTDGNTGSDDYGYDDNGNLVTDKNKHLQQGTAGTGLSVAAGNGAITYNHLNLPENIVVDGKGTIHYTYDASGNKLKKVTTEIGSTARTTTTFYINGFVYEQVNTEPVKLQYFGHEEGRVRPVEKTTVQEQMMCPLGYFEQDEFGNWVLVQPPCSRWLEFGSYQMYVYDYMIKDHLGNVRAVLTDEQQQNNYPPATVETYNSDPCATLQYEQQFYTIDESNIVDRQTYSIPEYENNNGIYNVNPYGGNPYATSEKVYRLNGSNANAKKGLDFVAKVMTGDHVDIFGKSYHNSTGNSAVPLSSSWITTLLSGLLGAPGSAAAAGSHGATAGTLSGMSSVSGPLQALQLTQQSSTSGSGNPQAGISWILFDEHFSVVDKHFSAVSGSGSVYDHYQDGDMQNIPVTKNGYLYVFCSNESAVNVFFDNLQVVHTRGPLLEETHYYPFGLTMQGISSKAAIKLGNKLLFNKGSELQHKEFNDGTGLDWYATNFRSLDPQLGRWLQIDPKPDIASSPYSTMDNNPILKNDPLGDVPDNYYMNSSGDLLAVDRDPNSQVDNFYRVSDDGKQVTNFAQRSLRDLPSDVVPGGWSRLPDLVKVAIVQNYEVASKSTNTPINDLGVGKKEYAVLVSAARGTLPNRIIMAYNIGNGTKLVTANMPINPQGANPAIVRRISTSTLPSPAGNQQKAPLAPNSFFPMLPSSRGTGRYVTDKSGNALPPHLQTPIPPPPPPTPAPPGFIGPIMPN